MKINLIVAASANNVIGKDNKLIFHNPFDMSLFRKLTMDNVVLMGRKTYESIGKPLPQRTNVVISTTLQPINNVKIYRSVDEALQALKNEKEIFVIGGGEIYKEFWDSADVICLTRFHQIVNGGDTFIPEIDLDKFEEIICNDFLQTCNLSFITYNRK